MAALDGQQDNGFFSRMIEGFKDVANNRNSSYDTQDALDIYTGDYEANRLDPSRRFDINLNKERGPLSNLYKTTNNPSNSTVFAFPIDLATSPDAETMHFMQFNMYEVQSAQMRDAQRLSTLLNENPLNEEDNSFVESLTDEQLRATGVPETQDRQILDTGAAYLTPKNPKDRIQARMDFLTNQNFRGGVNRRVRTSNPTRTLRQKRYKSKDTCFLYMPHKINNLSLQSYDTPSMLFASILGQSATSLMGAVKSAFSGEEGSGGEAMDELKRVMGSLGPIAMRKAIGALDSVASIVGMDTELEAAATQLLGQAINPRKELVYNSPELRTFEFSYEFYPRNLKESQMVEAIIKLFRFHSSPSLANQGNFLVPPSIFEIKFYKRDTNTVAENPFILKMRDCVLTEVNVDFTPNGNFSAFGSGAPVATTMSLTFKEIDINVKDDILEGF